MIRKIVVKMREPCIGEEGTIIRVRAKSVKSFLHRISLRLSIPPCKFVPQKAQIIQVTLLEGPFEGLQNSLRLWGASLLLEVI